MTKKILAIVNNISTQFSCNMTRRRKFALVDDFFKKTYSINSFTKSFYELMFESLGNPAENK